MTRLGRMLIGVVLFLTASAANACPCDCGGDDQVDVDELVVAVRIALDDSDPAACRAADRNSDGRVDVSELVAGAFAALNGCPARSAEEEGLAAARALWESYGAANYDYRLDVQCRCVPPHQALVEVRDGEVAAIRDPDTLEELHPTFVDNFMAVPQLFDFVESSLGSAETVRVSYDPTLGFPDDVFVDPSVRFDDEKRLRLTSLRATDLRQCRTDRDCSLPTGACIDPQASLPCGLCIERDAECQTSDDCPHPDTGVPGLCVPAGTAGCACDQSALVCEAHCWGAPEPCPINTECDLSSGQCAPRPCIMALQNLGEACSDNFDCVAESASRHDGLCQRRVCTSDENCEGFCVNRRCFGSLGTCGLSTGRLAVHTIDVTPERPWPGVRVSVSGTDRSATTDESGSATFELAPGEYFVDAQLCCRGPSKLDFHVPVAVSVGRTTEITLKGCSRCICAASDTPVATPRGEVAIRSLAVGDVVLSIHRGQVSAVPVAQTNRVAVERHTMVRVELANGSVLRMSPGHPTADGRTFGDLNAGDSLGGLAILSADLVPYTESYTYDILPASDSGVYFAGGVPVESTLRHSSSR